MSADTFNFGPFRLNTRERQLFAGGEIVPLRGKVFDTLRVLVENPNRLMRKDELMRAIWPEGIVEENNLDHNICIVRKALGQMLPGQKYIQTVPRQGYRFVPPSDEAIQRRTAVSQTSRTHRAAPSFIVEREGPLEQLRTALGLAEAGARQVVLITGEPGIGKTTLLRRFLEEIDSSSCWIAPGQCVDCHGEGEAYMPVLEAMSRMCRQNNGSAVRELLRQHAPAWLANMPGVAGAEVRETLRSSLLGLTAQRMSCELMDAMEALTAEKPLILVLEDLQWCDRATLDLLLKLSSGQDSARLLILCSYRPTEAKVSMSLHGLVSEMELRGHWRKIPLQVFTERGCEEYLNLRAPGIAPGLGEPLFKRTGGNPLFVTAVVDSWVTAGLLRREHDGWTALITADSVAGSMPETLWNMIEAQIRQLSTGDRELVEAASSAGNEFCAALIADTLDRSVEDVEASCGALAESGRFLEDCGTVEWPDGTVCARHRFVHELYQEVIFRRIPAGRRVRLHQQIGERLESAFRGHEEQVAAELAIHFREARDAHRAIRYLRTSAEQCLQRGGPEEAIFNLSAALQMLNRIPDQHDRTRYELGIHALLAPALASQKGFGDTETEKAFRRAYELSRKLGEQDRQFPVIFGFAVMLELRGEYRKAQNLMEQYLPEQERRCGFIQEARDLLACSLFHQAAFARALEHAEKGINAYRPGQHSMLSGSLGENPGVDCHSWAALSQWFLGQPEKALAHARKAVLLAEAPGHEYSLATARSQLAFLHQLRGEPEETQNWARAAMELALRQGRSYRHSVGQVLHGWALVQLGQPDKGSSELMEGITGCRTAGAELDRPYHLALLAEALIRAGKVGEAAAALDEALAKVQSTRSFFYEAELWRLCGVVADMQGQREKAAGYIEHAIEVAVRQGTKSLQLRAATSLAKLLNRKRDTSRAWDVLTPVLDCFTEGYDTGDFQDARTELKRTKAATARKRKAA